MTYELWHPTYGSFKTESRKHVDRKLAAGYVFYDEKHLLTDDDALRLDILGHSNERSETEISLDKKPRGRPKKETQEQARIESDDSNSI